MIPILLASEIMMSPSNPSGAVHPTAFLVAWFVFGFGLEKLWPVAMPGADLLQGLEVVLFVAGGLLFGWSAFELNRHDTTMEHKSPTTTLVTRGPYRLSRHPIYAALLLILLALSVESRSAWFFMLTLAFWAAVRGLTVRREEAYLEREFGDEYRRYQKAVRRWI